MNCAVGGCDDSAGFRLVRSDRLVCGDCLDQLAALYDQPVLAHRLPPR